MGFLDKIKEFFGKMKEDNKYFKRTMARINNKTNYYGYVNYRPGKVDPNEDFRNLSYLSVENGTGVIYNTGDEDYNFAPGDIVTFNMIGEGQPVRDGQDANKNPIFIPTFRFQVEFKDGKKTTMDVIVKKLDAFKTIFQL